MGAIERLMEKGLQARVGTQIPGAPVTQSDRLVLWQGSLEELELECLSITVSFGD